MTVSPPSSGALPAKPKGRRSKAWWRWVALAGALGLGILVWRQRPAPVELPSELAANLTRRDGRLYAPDSKVPFTGWMLERYPDAALKSRSQISNGVLQGISEGWHTNGVRQVEEHFVAGVSEGPVTKWHPDGAKLSEGTAHGGKLEGLFRRWHPNGVLSEELTLVGGQPGGISRAWFPSGSLKAEVVLEQGRVVTQKFWQDGERPPEAALAGTGGGR